MFKTISGVKLIHYGQLRQWSRLTGSVTMLCRGLVSINSSGEKIYPEEF